MWVIENELLVNINDALTVNEINVLNWLQWHGSLPQWSMIHEIWTYMYFCETSECEFKDPVATMSPDIWEDFPVEATRSFDTLLFTLHIFLDDV